MTQLAIGSMPAKRITISRRQMLKMGAAMAAGGLSACYPQSEEQAQAARARGIAPWPNDVAVPTVDHPGYGTYPDYDAIGATGPWPKILSARHKAQLERSSDLILPATDTAPAPSEVGIGAFFDDWVSAPYPYMTDTRRVVHQGFAWLDTQMRMDHGTDWLGASDLQAKRQLNRMRDVAKAIAEEPQVTAPNATAVGTVAKAERDALVNPAGMYTHLRKLVIGAYYTTPEGEADLGHVPAEVTGEDYAGPTGEALDHILGMIAELGLDASDLPIGPPPYDVRAYSFTGDEPA